MCYLSLLVFLDKCSKYEPYLCNGSHDLIQKPSNLNDIIIVYAKGSDSRLYFCYVSKDDAISITKNSSLNEKKGLLNFFPLYKKWVIKLLIIEKKRNGTK